VKLMIVESPNKTAKIAAILGEGWKVSASIGHIRDLPRKSIGVVAPDYKPEYVFTDTVCASSSARISSPSRTRIGPVSLQIVTKER
jgi:DNA topoisomerase IA